MSNVDISVIIPSKNNKSKTAGIIKKISDEIKGISVEFVVIDMDSSDGGVLETLDLMKKKRLFGCVIQSGSGSVSSALNTGLYRCSGKYVSFIYPTRLYKNYISEFFDTAEKSKADFVFSSPVSSGENKNSVPESLFGADLAADILQSKIKADFAAVLIRREFMIENRIKFCEECNFGYAESFLLNLLMYNPECEYVNINLERDYDNEVVKEENAPLAKNGFERLDAMLQVYDTAKKRQGNNKRLIEIIEYNKLPSLVISCIDMLIKEGFSSSSIKKLLRSKHYDDYIKSSNDTPYLLRRKIFVWNTSSWVYEKIKSR